MSILSLRAQEIMTQGVHAIDADASLREAAAAMGSRDLHCLLVRPSKPQRAHGIITTKDIVQLLASEDVDVLDEMLVEDVMTRPVITVQVDMVVQDCVALMKLTGVRRMPVMRGSEIVGFLSYSDVLRHAVGAT